MIQAIRFAADSGIPIINISLGSPGEAPALLQALQYAVQRGSFITMPAGNSFLEGNPADYPAAYAVQVEGSVEVAATGRSRRVVSVRIASLAWAAPFSISPRRLRHASATAERIRGNPAMPWRSSGGK